LLSQHPAAEEKVVDELDQAGLLAHAGRREPRELQYDDLGRLPYLGYVIKARFCEKAAVTAHGLQVANLP
jgi:hypothetical protein